jgi:hypothetical protein
MESQDTTFVPSFEITCPGGMKAQFLYRKEDKLYWKGQMPYGQETAAGKTHYYTLITDLEGNELETKEI